MLAAGASDDDAPALQVITLTEMRAGSHVFVSKALMRVADETDAEQDAHSGLNPPLTDACIRHRGESNHRLRWNRIGLTIESGATVNRAIPVGAPGPDAEAAALGDLLPVTPDNTLPAVLVPLPDPGSFAAFRIGTIPILTTTRQATTSSTGRGGDAGRASRSAVPSIRRRRRPAKSS